MTWPARHQRREPKHAQLGGDNPRERLRYDDGRPRGRIPRSHCTPTAHHPIVVVGYVGEGAVAGAFLLDDCAYRQSSSPRDVTQFAQCHDCVDHGHNARLHIARATSIHPTVAYHWIEWIGPPTIVAGGRHDVDVSYEQYRVFPPVLLLESASTSRDNIDLLLVVVGPVDGGKAPPIAYVVESDGMSRHLEARAGVGRQRRLPQTQDADHVMEYRILHASLSLFKGGIY